MTPTHHSPLYACKRTFWGMVLATSVSRGPTQTFSYRYENANAHSCPQIITLDAVDVGGWGGG
eukprot:jgi/Botrbrau1/16357/Bobra.178_1s0010.1